MEEILGNEMVELTILVVTIAVSYVVGLGVLWWGVFKLGKLSASTWHWYRNRESWDDQRIRVLQMVQEHHRDVANTYIELWKEEEGKKEEEEDNRVIE